LIKKGIVTTIGDLDIWQDIVETRGLLEKKGGLN